ncbi:hypothetical protein, partial [Pseudomonas fluorescens]|uniref:hypothetical protein n=1 Tax=Pseudomonas fluorescens TaxID=294 RepID=UPI0009E4646A
MFGAQDKFSAFLGEQKFEGHHRAKVGAGLPAMTASQLAHERLIHRHRSLGIPTTLQAVAANANHDAQRVALDLLLILGAPSNHAGRNSTGIWGVNRQ